MSSTPLFGVIGGTLWGNRGAEAMVSATIGQIRQRFPRGRFALYSYYAAADRRLLNDPAVEVFNCAPLTLMLVHLPCCLAVRLFRAVGFRWPNAVLPRGVRRLRECRVLCDVQGISFDDGRLLYLPFKILTIWPAILLGTPVVKLSQAMGPFHKAPNRLAARWLLSKCERSNARGRATAAYLKRLRLEPTKWGVAADVAFVFADGDSLTNENTRRTEAVAAQLDVARAAGQEIAAIAPSSLVMSKQVRQGRDYIKLLALLAERLLDRGFDVLVLPNATREGSRRLRNNDLVAVDRLRARLEVSLPPETRRRLHFVDYDINTDGIRRLLSYGSLLVASRFHAMVAGLSLGIPALVLGWSHKYAEVLADFGMEDYAVDFTEPDEQVLARLEELCQSRSEAKDRIRSALARVRQSSLSQFAFLDALTTEVER